ncbi:MAG: type IV secretion system protein [Wolbachia endosymbiont of Tyrophagus putrescentiae]|nr:type IV secretion system protein [Wolbachia endosymbiont of Tyrophagus putrescentiae]
MTDKRLLLLILCFVITSCTMDCVEPGLQSRNTNVNVDVPVGKNDNNIINHQGKRINWIDSDQVIGKGEKIKFTIDGSINFCPYKKDINPVEVLVPAVFCSDGSLPDYGLAEHIDGDKLTNKFGLDGQELCRGKGFVQSGKSSNRRYVDAKIKVNPGDKLIFHLVPRRMAIDCKKLKYVTLDGNLYKTSEINEQNKATPQDICRGGDFYDNKRKKESFPLLEKNKIGNASSYDILVGNGYTPYDNKVYFNVDKKISWMDGALLDLRRTKVGLDQDEEDEKKKYSAYELNCYLQNICYNLNTDKQRDNCVSSIRYEKYEKEGKCDMYSYFKRLESKRESVSLDENNNQKAWAEALVAKIASSIDYHNTPEDDRFDVQDEAQGAQCLPESEGNKKCSKITSKNFKDFSLQLGHEYTVDNVQPGSGVMLAIAGYGNYRNMRGGYYVKVEKSCKFSNGEKLYLYFGDEFPDSNTPISDFYEVKNIDEGTRNLGKIKLTKDSGMYVIDGEGLNDDQSKKVYFGIDMTNIHKEDIVDEDGKYHQDNKYTVSLFVNKKVNDFISSTVNMIFEYIAPERTNSNVNNTNVEGSTVGGTVKDLYEGYRKGLIQGVRALLILYVIFSVMGYMLGMLQLSKYDFIVRMIKIAFVALVFSDRSWEIFGEKLSMLFIGGSNYLVNSFAGYVGEGGKNFAFLDLTVGVLFTGETWLKFLSLMLAGPFGFMAFLVILYATGVFLKCILSAILRYVIAVVLCGFLLSLTPLFIAFLLFQQTKSLFDGWIKTLAHIAVQPVILFSSLSLLNQLMYSVLYNLTNFSACYQCLISIDLQGYDFCIMKSILPLGYGAGTGVDVALDNGVKGGGYFAALPIDLVQVFIYLIIASAMETFAYASESIAQQIFSSGWGVVGSVSRVASGISQGALSTIGLDDETQRMISRVKGMGHRSSANLVFKGQTSRDKGDPKSDKSSEPEKRGSSEKLTLHNEKKGDDM